MTARNTPQTNPEHAWRRREAVRTAVCGTLSFILTISLLTFGSEHLTGWLTFFGLRSAEVSTNDFAPEPPPRRELFGPAAVPAPTQQAVRHMAPPATPVIYKAAKPVRKSAQPLPASVVRDMSTSDTTATFPAFIGAVHPVSRVPNWGAMRTPAEWNRTYQQMSKKDFVAIPEYNLEVLTIPTKELLKDREKNTPILTAKLYYSTRFFSSYSIDAGEFTGMHAGMDFKLPIGTPIGVIGGGRVFSVSQNENLGLHVVVEHRIPTKGTFYSIYGHLGTASVQAGQHLAPGAVLGTVGMTGKTTAGHLHLQIDPGQPGQYAGAVSPRGLTLQEALTLTVHPLQFIAQNSKASLQIVEEYQNRPIEVTGRQSTIVGG